MKWSSWKKNLFLSYIFVAVIPLLVLGMFYFYGNRISMNQELEKSHSTMLDQVMQRMDYLSEKMNSTALHFSGLELADKLDDVRNQAVTVDTGMVASQLSTYSDIVGGTKTPISTILYIRGETYIYTQDGRVEYSDFEKEMKQYGDLNQILFYKKLNSLKTGTSVQLQGSLEETEKQDDEKTITFFLYPIPYMNSIPVGTIGFSLDSEAMEDMIDTYYNMDSMFYIFNEQMQEIYRHMAHTVPEDDFVMLDEIAANYRRNGGKFGRESVNGRSYIVMKTVSSNSGYTLISITPKKDFYNYQNPFIVGYLILMTILLWGGVILAIILSRKNYRPIQNLIEKTAVEDEDQTAENEFELLHNRWENIRDKNMELNIMMNRQRPMVVSSCLRQLLKGKFKDRQLMETALKSAAINLEYPFNFVILLSIPMKEGFDSEKNTHIMSVLMDGGLPGIHLYGLDMLKDNGIIVIVNCGQKYTGPENKDVRLSVSNFLYQKLKMEYGIEIPFCMGRIYEDPMEINRSFIEAAAIADEYKMLGRQKIVLFEEMGREEENMYYPILEQTVYIQCLKQANVEAALKALDNIVKEIGTLKSFVITQCLCFDIINLIIKTLNQMKGFELKNVDLKKVCSFTNLKEFQENTSELTSQICIQFAEFKNSQNNELKAGILNYVNQHYGDCNMGLEAVADEFGVTANYLSRFFKQETGCTFIQYITMIRMDRAKELLMNSDIPVKDIVTRIGYMDTANFVRKFKNYEGITPGQYREKMQAEMK